MPSPFQLIIASTITITVTAITAPLIELV